MIDDVKQAEIVEIFMEYKRDLEIIERLIRAHDMPQNLLPIFSEQMQMRTVGKSMHKAYVRNDKDEITKEKIKDLKTQYNLLIEQGFDKCEAMQLMTGFDNSPDIHEKEEHEI